MPFATTRTLALSGAVGHVIDVQADVSPGQVATVLVGRPDSSLHEARDRCRMAIINSSLDWPSSRRTTILLSPADLPKRGTHYDLAIAVAVLGATGVVPAEALGDVVLIGELTLAGGLRSVPGVLPMVMAASQRGFHHVVVPEPQAHEASMVPGMNVLGMRSLGQVVAELRDEPVPEAPPVAAMSSTRLLSWRGAGRMDEVDLADLVGMEETRYAVEVAAAGGHHLLLSGPKGCGKTSIAERLPGLLPDLTREEALELTAVHSLAGALEPGDGLLTRPPFAAPHHDASTSSLVGGGSGTIRPGEISRAHCGVLLLDEFPLFRADVINALRQPLESGDISVARAEESVILPARSIVVLAANPCPCGDYHANARLDHCKCREVQRRDYRRKVTGPITDRIDITRHLAAVTPTASRDPLAVRENSATVRARVTAARERQADRYHGEAWRLNGHAPGPALAARWPLTTEATDLVDDQLWKGRLTRRGVTRVQRLAWTVADLAGVDQPGVAETDVALRLRSGTPLLAAALRRAVG
ncbi:MAG TPA: YifB family Mg chelatase-like AAA ATPase [Nocardioides sp.]|nr:YifB family Mg chelatase-like AAA ATPase [Nocardioides sp.]